MFEWFAQMMWAWCLFAADACTFVGLTGLLVFAGIGLWKHLTRLEYAEGGALAPTSPSEPKVSPGVAATRPSGRGAADRKERL